MQIITYYFSPYLLPLNYSFREGVIEWRRLCHVAIKSKWSILAPISSDLMTTTSYTTMKSMVSHQASSSKMEKLALPITGDSSFEPNNKKQRKEAQRRV
jgi:hypothetical protein